MKIIRYEASVYYANVDNFIYKIIKLSGLEPNELIAKINKKKAEYERLKKDIISGGVIIIFILMDLKQIFI
jgi:hypothetical protein